MLIPFDCPADFDPERGILWMRFSPGGTRLLVAREGGSWAVVLDVSAGKQVHHFTGLNWLAGMLFLSEERLLLFDETGCTLHDLANGRQELWGGENLPARNGWGSSDPDRIALTGAYLLIYNVADQQRLYVLHTPVRGNFTIVCFSPDGRYAANDRFVERESRAVEIWDLRTGRLYRLLAIERVGDGDAGGLAISPDNRLLALSVDSGAEVYGMKDGREIASHDPGPSITRNLRFSPSGRSLEMVSFRGEMARVHPKKGHVLQRSQPPAGHKVSACAVNAHSLAAGVVGKAVLVWQLPEWEEGS